jgi:PAS domain-containing protein
MLKNFSNAPLAARPVAPSAITCEYPARIDMAERRRAEAALKVSETRYRRLFETAKDGILLLDAVSGQITDVNPFLIELSGYTREELLGEKLWEIGPFKDVVASQAAFRELQQKMHPLRRATS